VNGPTSRWIEGDDVHFDEDAFEPDAPAGAPLAELNEPQAQAAGHVDGPLLVFAGAGSGKTRVITFRVANLVACHRVPPYKILAVTFTNKAAGEMKQRLEGLIGPELTRDLWVGTFHAICAKVLRQHHDAAGLSRSFVIYDDADQRALMTRVLRELGLDEKRYPPRQVLARIHKEKQEGRTAADYKPEGWVDEAVAKCFEAYERHMTGANAVDFEDLILKVMLLAEDPESVAGADLRRRFKYVLVDEFQDVNVTQYRLLRALVHDHGNLCVVGDDDQSIYRWRGADVRNIRGFRRDFPAATVVKLEQNYRSTGNVVKSALGVIKPAKEREPKELWTARKDGEPVEIVAAANEHDEAAWVVEKIRETVARGVSPRDVAVFYRVHAQSRVLEEVMRAENVPYQIIGGTKFFDRAEVKDLIAYLRVLDNPKSDVDLLRIINVPPRKIGDTTVERLVHTADAMQSSLRDAIVPHAEKTSGPAKKSLLAFHDLLQALAREALTAPPSVLADEVLERSGYRKMLESDDSVEAEARLQNLEELVGSIADYEEEAAAAGQTGTLSGYLERVTLAADVDSLEEAPRVAMMTVHAAKGLEFHTVFITGMEEELFPFRSADAKRNEDAEEERRLAYVALTRARERLYVTHASRRMIFGQTRYGIPSRFLGDIPRSAVRDVATASASLEGRRFAGLAAPAAPPGPRAPWVHPMDRGDDHAQHEERAARPYAGRPNFEPARAPGERYVEREVERDDAPAEDGAIARGARVWHDKFQAGVVVSVDAGADPIVTVRFPGYGDKRIKASFLRAR
jgi:DNA helicase-2/ATP-dependent DNA helicase PcrA